MKGIFFSLVPKTGLEIGGASGKMVFAETPNERSPFSAKRPDFLNHLPNIQTRTFANRRPSSGRTLKETQNRKRRMEPASRLAIVLVMFGLNSCAAWPEMQFTIFHGKWMKAIGQTMIKQMDLGGPVLDTWWFKMPPIEFCKDWFPTAPDRTHNLKFMLSKANRSTPSPCPEDRWCSSLDCSKGPKGRGGWWVLAHEIAHVTERHGIDRLVQSVGIMSLVQLAVGDNLGLLGLGAQLMSIAAINSYSREQETAADAVGVKMLHDAGISHEPPRKLF